MGTNYKAPIWRMPENANKNVVSNYSMAFDGSESINCGVPTLFNGSTTATISAWVKFRNVTDPDYTSIVSIGTVTTTADLFLRVVPQGSSRRIECGITNSFARAGTSDFSDIPSDTWTHFMCFIDRDRNDGSDVSIFLNGSEIFTSDINSSMANPITQDLLLGSGSGWGNLNGNLSHVALWNTDQRANASAIWNGGTPFNLMVLNNKPNIYYQLGDNSNPNATAGYPNISTAADSVFEFTQSNSYPQTIDFGNPFSTSNKITFAIWFNSTTTIGSNTGYTILSRGSVSSVNGCFVLMVRNNNEFQCWFYDDSGTSPNPVLGSGTDFRDYNDGKWHHIAITIDGTLAQPALKMYLDGVLASSATSPNTGINQPTASVNQLLLGQRQYTYSTLGAKYSNLCTFDDVLDLTGTQSITSLYNNGTPPDVSNYNNLTGWWKLDQSANWEADAANTWQIPDAVSAYPQSFNFSQNKIITTPNVFSDIVTGSNKMGVCTISYWYKTQNVTGSYEDYMSLNDATSLAANFRVDSSNRFYYRESNNYLRFAAQTNLDEWNHHCWVFNSATSYDGTVGQTNGDLQFYVNGVAQAVEYNFVATPANSPWDRFNIARSEQGSGSGLDFEMSNLQLYNTNFSAPQVLQLYNNGVPLPTNSVATNNLKAWYKLDNTAKYINYPQNLSFTPDYWSFDPGNITPGATEALNFSGGYQNLPGTYEGLDFNDTALTDNKFILSWWWNSTKPGGDAGYIYFQNASSQYLSFYVYNGNMIIYMDPATTGTNFWRGTIPVAETGWSHVAVYMNQGSGTTWDASDTNNMKVFVNGSEISNSSGAGSITSAGVRTVINQLMMSTGGNFEGYQWSNFSLLTGNNAVTSAISTLYNGGTPGDISSLNPTWWYKLNSSDTSFPTSTPPTTAANVFTVTDSSGNGNTTTGPFYYARSLTTPSQAPSIQKVNVVANQAISSGMTEQNLVNNNVSVLNGESGGLNTANLVKSNLTRKQPFSNYSINFDGTSEYIKLANSSTAIVDWTQPYSISLWVRYSTALSWDLMATFGVETGSTSTTRYIMIGGNSGYLFTGVGDADGGETTIHFNIGSALDQGDWHHLVYVGDGTSGDFPSVYIDGVLTPYSGGTTALINDSTYLNVIGTGSTATGRYFPGKMSNVSIFNTALSQDDVLNLYNNGITQDLNNFRIKPEGWWPMDQSYTYFNGSVLVARDVINSSDGTAVNIIQENLKGDAPGSEVNGTGTNLTIADLEGNMKNSVNNSNSINMGDYASGTNPANSGRSTEIPQV